MEKSWNRDWKKSPGNPNNHYDDAIQPIEYIASDYPDSLIGNVIKYVIRHKKKNGREDLEKARWYVDWINRAMGHRPIHGGDFIAANKLKGDTREIILLLERFQEIKDTDPVAAQALLTTVDNHIVSLLKQNYE